jgi:hypothetical protein
MNNIDFTAPTPAPPSTQALDFLKRQVEEKRTKKSDGQMIAVIFVSHGQRYRVLNIASWGAYLRLQITDDDWILASPESGHFLTTLITPETPAERREIGFKP